MTLLSTFAFAQAFAGIAAPTVRMEPCSNGALRLDIGAVENAHA